MDLIERTGMGNGTSGLSFFYGFLGKPTPGSQFTRPFPRGSRSPEGQTPDSYCPLKVQFRVSRFSTFGEIIGLFKDSGTSPSFVPFPTSLWIFPVSGVIYPNEKRTDLKRCISLFDIDPFTLFPKCLGTSLHVPGVL